jgi:hypothetical protein
LIFQPSSHIDPRLADIATEIEAQEIGLRVVSARVFRLPFHRMRVGVMVQSPRRFNVLEEFLLRAAKDLEPRLTRKELATLLGLDPLFIEATTRDLLQLGAVTIHSQDRLGLTDLGHQYYTQGHIPRPPEEETVYLAYLGTTDQLTETQTLESADRDDPILPGILFQQDEQQSEQDAIVAAGDLSRVIDAVTAAGLSLHVPSEGRLIVDVENPVVEEADFIQRGVFAVLDTIIPSDAKDNVTLRIVDTATSQRDIPLEQTIDTWIKQERIGLTDLLPRELEMPVSVGVEGEVEPVERPIHARLAVEIYREQTIAARQKTQEVPPVVVPSEAPSVQGTVELLRDSEIRPRFVESLQKARHTILIISPWISEEVVDDDFVRLLKDLAERRVLTLAGWGIAHKQQAEDRVPPQSLLNRLHHISTPDGVPAVNVWWVGNQHSKDVLIDQAIHMSGSFNWLSYRGDRVPRGESTYYITVPAPVHSALEYIEQLFAGTATKRWEAASRHPRESMDELRRCCVTWVAARKPGEGIGRVLDLAGSDTSAVPQALELAGVVCLSLAHLPIETLVSTRALDSMGTAIPALVRYARSANCPEQLQGLGHGLKQLLRCYLPSNQSDISSFLQKHREILETIGVIKPRLQADDICVALQ